VIEQRTELGKADNIIFHRYIESLYNRLTPNSTGLIIWPDLKATLKIDSLLANQYETKDSVVKIDTKLAGTGSEKRKVANPC